MTLDPDVCYRALRTRDARFDGRFVTAVRSTGIYCRPVCPARTPRPENCLFLPCAAAAQEAGFRPCLRCRPESAPGTPAWLGTSATVSRALRLIDEGALDDAGVEALAARLGVGARHLRRLFLRHLGASPLAVAQTRRVQFARRLIDETNLSMAEVALASGFASVRCFNAALHRVFGRAPRELRRARAPLEPAPGTPEIRLRLAFRPPLHWEALIAFLALRATPGVEQAGPDGYARTFCLGEVRGLVEVRPLLAKNLLLARIRVAPSAGVIQVAQRLRNLFDLDADPAAIAGELGRDPLLARRLDAWPGVRVPGAFDGFELAVRAILGQQVSVRGATTLAGRLVAEHGEPLPEALREPAPAPDRLFPGPERLAAADLGRCGLTRARAEAVRELARAVARHELALEPGADPERTLERLRAIRGIGEWTAQYVAMRALREPDAFPQGDLGLRRALGGATGPISGPALRQRAERWRPWRAYAALLLWLGEPSPRAASASRASSARLRASP